MLYLFRNLWTVHSFVFYVFCYVFTSGCHLLSSSYSRNAITGTWATIVPSHFLRANGVNFERLGEGNQRNNPAFTLRKVDVLAILP